MTLGGAVAFFNWWTIYLSRNREHFVSPAPLVGALLLGIGMYLVPATRPYAWLALILDYGTLSLIIAVPWIANDIWKTSSINLLEEFAGKNLRKSVKLCLYRNGVFTLLQRFHTPANENGVMKLSTCGKWQRCGTQLHLIIEEHTAIFEPLLRSPNVVRQTSGFPFYENTGCSLADIQFERSNRS